MAFAPCAVNDDLAELGLSEEVEDIAEPSVWRECDTDAVNVVGMVANRKTCPDGYFEVVHLDTCFRGIVIGGEVNANDKAMRSGDLCDVFALEGEGGKASGE